MKKSMLCRSKLHDSIKKSNIRLATEMNRIHKTHESLRTEDALQVSQIPMQNIIIEDSKISDIQRFDYECKEEYKKLMHENKVSYTPHLDRKLVKCNLHTLAHTMTVKTRPSSKEKYNVKYDILRQTMIKSKNIVPKG